MGAYLKTIFRHGPWVLLSVILLSMGAQAQDRSSETADGPFVEATVVTAEGDSLHGQVRWKRGYSTPEEVRFRSSPTDVVQTFSPSEVRAVDVADGRRLVRRVAEVSQVPLDPKKAHRHVSRDRPMTRADTLLLEVVVEGTLRLYAKQGRRDRYILADGEDVVELLKIRKRPSPENNIVTNHLYRRQLREATVECADVAAETETVELELRDVKELVVQYNRCVGDADVYVREDPSLISMSFSITGGVMRSQYAMNEPSTSFQTFGWGNGLMLGVGVTTRFLQTDGHLGIRAELTGTVQRISPEAGTRFFRQRLSDNNFVEMRWAELKVLPRYFFADEKWQPYAEVGFLLGYLLSIQEETPPFYFLYPFDQKTIGGFVEENGRFTLGLAAGIGGQYESVRIGVRAKGTPGWNEYTPIRSSLISIVLTTEYHF